MNMRIGGLLLLALPLIAGAEGFKCKLADGSLSFQEQPCPAGAVSSAMPSAPETSGIGGPASMPKAAPSARASSRGDPRQPQDRARDAERRKADEEINARNQEAAAFNKMQRCNYARNQLGVAKEYKPIYRRDDKGDRQYVEEKNRPSEVAAAEQRVAAACN